MKKLNKNESGQALVFAAVSGMILLGFMALATDAGVLLHTRKQMQSAADSAALAGAYEFTLTGTYSSAAQEGLLDAAKNGFSSATNCPATPNTSGATVCIKEPTNDSNANFNARGYVEADISEPTPTPLIRTFLAWFNPGQPPLTVAARAVAVSQGGGGGSGLINGCIDTLATTGSSTMDFQGSFTVKVPGCPVNDRSTDPDALTFTGGGGTLSACGPSGTDCGSVGVVGGTGGPGNHPGDSTPAPVTGIGGFSDPLLGRELDGEIPNLTSSCSAAPAGINSGTQAAPFTPAWQSITPANSQLNPVSGTAYPAYNAVCYSGNVTLSTSGTGSSATGYLAGGVYVFTGNVTLDGLIASNITIVIAGNGSLSVSPAANETININAPPLNLSGSPDNDLWNGMLIYQVASDTNTINAQVGSSSGTYGGIIYAPTAEFFLQDSGGDKNGGVTLETNLIVGTLEDKTASMTITCYTCTEEGSVTTSAGVFPRITLVE